MLGLVCMDVAFFHTASADRDSGQRHGTEWNVDGRPEAVSKVQRQKMALRRQPVRVGGRCSTRAAANLTADFRLWMRLLNEVPGTVQTSRILRLTLRAERVVPSHRCRSPEVAAIRPDSGNILATESEVLVGRAGLEPATKGL